MFISLITFSDKKIASSLHPFFISSFSWLSFLYFYLFQACLSLIAEAFSWQLLSHSSQIIPISAFLSVDVCWLFFLIQVLIFLVLGVASDFDSILNIWGIVLWGSGFYLDLLFSDTAHWAKRSAALLLLGEEFERSGFPFNFLWPPEGEWVRMDTLSLLGDSDNGWVGTQVLY